MCDFKCNKCKRDIDIAESELWELYGDNDHEYVSCPMCDEEICIKVEKTYSFECIDEADV
jgi:DNA-directed RNA polymerase subunit RPC12/RpoP